VLRIWLLVGNCGHVCPHRRDEHAKKVDQAIVTRVDGYDCCRCDGRKLDGNYCPYATGTFVRGWDWGEDASISGK